MSMVEWHVKKLDYDNKIAVYIKMGRTKGGEDLPTNGDLLDAMINVVAPEIRKGNTVGEQCHENNQDDRA